MCREFFTYLCCGWHVGSAGNVGSLNKAWVTEQIMHVLSVVYYVNWLQIALRCECACVHVVTKYGLVSHPGCVPASNPVFSE